jgi:hypothetical protein
MTTRGAGLCGVREVVSESSGVGEEFGGFDAAGGEVGDEFAIGEEKIVVGEFPGEDPDDLLECVGNDVQLGVLCGEEMDFEFFGSVGVVVADVGDLEGFGEGDTEFFADFASESLFERFLAADFAAWKFPFKGGGVIAAALADEDAAIGTFDYSCNDLDHELRLF